MFAFLFLVVFLVNSLDNTSANNSCVPRDYGKGGTVCVCNITYCDTFDEIIKTIPGVITRYESNKEGKRFEKKSFKFSNQSYHSFESKGKTVKINRNKKYQRIIGFGGAFTDAAGINILSLGSQMSQRIINDYFSPNGLSYSMARIPIAGTDFSLRKYTYDDHNEDLELKYFALAEEDLKYKIPLIKLAQNVSTNGIKIFGSPWSAPAWMKTNNDLAGNGTLKGAPGGPYYKAWANYFVKFLNAYKSQGVDLWGVTVQNEPIDGLLPGFVFNCMGLTGEQQKEFIAKDLGPTLEAAGYGVNKLKLMIIDDQRFLLNDWANIILNDSSSAKYVSGIAFHWYFNSVSAATELDTIQNEFPDVFLLSTEACEGSAAVESDKVLLGNWGRGENYAYDIITDLLHYTTGWVDWNLALDVMGGPTWISNFVDAPIIVNATAKEYYKQPMYYSLAHFTKFLSPNSQRVDTQDSGTTQVLETVVFDVPNNGTVLIAVNRLNDSIPLTIIDPNFGNLETTVSPHSLQTYVWFK